MRYVPMLAEPIVDGQLERLLADDEWAVEQKMNGMRVVFVIKDSTAKAFNRRGEGFRQHIPREVYDELSDPNVFQDNQVWVFDGEILEDTYAVFDLLSTPNGDAMDLPLRLRRDMLQAIFEEWDPEHVVLVPHARDTRTKTALLNAVERMGGEGVMFKHLDNAYEPGTRSTAMLKHKLWASADVIVTGPHPEGKRSVQIAAFEGLELVGLGSVSVADRWLQRLEVGDVIEVKYLYRGAQGHLYQSSLLRERRDKNPYECTLDQLKPVCKDMAEATIESNDDEGER